MTKVALVTGGNKGIGFAIVEGLCKQFDGTVFLSGRDPDRVRIAADQLRSQGHSNLETCILDLDNRRSVQDAKDMLVKRYGGLDILINNAGIAFKASDTTTFDIQARVTMDTDYHALVSICDVMFPILRSGARVVHLSSMCSMFAFRKCSDARKKEVLACDTIAKVTGVMNEFVEKAQTDKHTQHGWPSHGYGMAKMGVSMVTPIQQKNIDADTTRTDIVVNCCCPGYVNTDMTSHLGPKTIQEGADTPLYLAFLPPATKLRGHYFTEKKVADWTEGSITLPK